MRYLVLAGVLALAGCSSQWVRCERHLTPINGARTTAAAADGAGRMTDPVGRGARESTTAVSPQASPSMGRLR